MTADRKLASIRKIGKITPIDGADNIEKISVDGWNCIAKKGEFQEGDHCVYFEIDSFLPIWPEFEFLRKLSFKKMGDQEGFRLKTIRLKGVLSQGLVMPLSILYANILYKYNFYTFNQLSIIYNLQHSPKNGEDVTDFLGVIKFEPPIPAELQGIAKGSFPSFIRKTDQERVQNIWNDIKNTEESFEVTLKLDGTSCTYFLYNDEFGVCSRNFELQESETNTLWKVARKYKIEELLREHGHNIALQGEIIGEGIQNNPENIKGQDFYLFDIWNIDKQRYFYPEERRLFHKSLFQDLKHIAVLDKNRYLTGYKNIESILEVADIIYPTGKVIEGIVFKSNQSNLTFKVISNKYLLEKDK